MRWVGGARGGSRVGISLGWLGRVILRVGGTLARYYISEQYLTS